MSVAMEEEPAPLMEETLNQEQALELLTSLISSSYSVRCFPFKWQLIRDKLEQLSSGLNACFGDSNNPAPPSPFLQSLVSNLRDVESVSVRCIDETYNGGRLLLKSDLDYIISMLDHLIKHFSEICLSLGVSAAPHSQAIVLARPAVGAGLDDLRFYLKDLFSRLRIGGFESKSQALVILTELFGEDQRYVRIVALEIFDGLSLLVNLIECGDTGVQEVAAGAISAIAAFDSYRGALAREGAMAPLLRLLETGGGLAKERSAQALGKLTENSDNVWSFSAHGGVSALLDICTNGDSCTSTSSELISSSCKMMKNLSRVEEIKRFMVEEGAVSVLIKLSKSKEFQIQQVCGIQAVDLLYAMALDDDDVKQRVIHGGLIESLVELLDPDSPFSIKAREISLKAIDLFYLSTGKELYVLIGSGLIHWVLFYLNCDESAVQELALKIVWQLCKISDHYKYAIGQAGVMNELVSLLEAKSVLVREMAAEMLSGMVSFNPTRQMFIQGETNVKRLMQFLLEPINGDKSQTTKFLLSALMAVAESSTGRRKVIASGYIHNLEKLSDSGVLDAKKIMKKLSSNRFRSIINKILSVS